MRVFITGVGGFLGSIMARYHLAKGDEVLGLDNLSTGTMLNIQDLFQNTSFRYVDADICTWNGYEQVLAGIELVYHFAAVVGVFEVLNHPQLVLNVNISGTQRLLEAIQRHAADARVFLASSSEVYGQQNQKKYHEAMDICLSMSSRYRMNYPVSKLCAEAYGITYHDSFGLKITILRLFNIIGRGQISTYGMVVPRFIAAAKKGENLTVFGDGQQERSFCDVRDLIQILQALINCSASYGQIINIGHDTPIKIIDLAKLIISLSNSSSSISFLSYEQAYNEHTDFTMHRCPDLSRLYAMIDYRHQWDLKTTLKELIAYAA